MKKSLHQLICHIIMLRKAWKTINNSNDTTFSTPPCLINSSLVSHQLLNNCTMSSKPKRLVLHTDTTGEGTLVYHFSKEEYKEIIAAIKNGKAAGIDDVLVKQQSNIGPT